MSHTHTVWSALRYVEWIVNFRNNWNEKFVEEGSLGFVGSRHRYNFLQINIGHLFFGRCQWNQLEMSIRKHLFQIVQNMLTEQLELGVACIAHPLPVAQVSWIQQAARQQNLQTQPPALSIFNLSFALCTFHSAACACSATCRVLATAWSTLNIGLAAPQHCWYPLSHWRFMFMLKAFSPNCYSLFNMKL